MYSSCRLSLAVKEPSAPSTTRRNRVKLLAGTRKGLFTFEFDDKKWRMSDRQFLGDPVPMLLPVPENNQLFTVLGTGHFGTKLHRSDDSGQSYSEVATPVYPEKPADSGDLVPWSLELIWSLEKGLGDTLWCGTIPGGVFTSTDAGESWQLNENLWNLDARRKWMGGGYDWPGVHSICVDPRDASVVTLGISIGGVYRTTDNGNSWKPRGEGLRADYVPPDIAGEPDQQDPHRIAQCAADPDYWWMQHHNGIWRSSDDCATWQEIMEVQPSTFGFALAVHPTDGNTAWFVPSLGSESRYPVGAKMVVNRTVDGGGSFMQLKNGLPQEDAYDLVYRHCLEICPSGDMLVMGSTSGNLWFSNDAGDHWEIVSRHLPPILCLRYVEFM